jgi:pyridinium-3,5-biscarboxylic acid mononucleotide sulfurtransferase
LTVLSIHTVRVTQILEKSRVRQTVGDPAMNQSAAAEQISPPDRKTASPEALADQLVAILADIESVAVAVSGGVDSTVVAKAAHLALGDRAVAVTGKSPSLAASELEHAKRAADAVGIRHLIFETHEFEDENYVRNDGARCYYCKSELYDILTEFCAKEGFLVVCSGANRDDLGDYRPGLTAAAERGVRHPLQEAGFGKEEVRILAAYWRLPNWDKPASPCLSSRIAVGLEATPERVQRIEAAEALLRELGFRDFRVRCHHGELARIETIPEDIVRIASDPMRTRVTEEFKKIGFNYVSVDLEGFRSGSLNVMVPVELLSKR